MGATPGDPDTDLAHVLGMDASSTDLPRAGTSSATSLLWNMAGFLGLPGSGVAAWWQEHLAGGRAQLDALGYAGWDPRVIHGALFPADFPVSSPTVTDGPLSETDPLPADAAFGGEQVNYITWLRSAAIDDIRAGNYPGPAVPDTLLYKVLRQSVLLDYVTLAQFAQVGDGELALAQTRESELVGMAVGADGRARPGRGHAVGGAGPAGRRRAVRHLGAVPGGAAAAAGIAVRAARAAARRHGPAGGAADGRA